MQSENRAKNQAGSFRAHVVGVQLRRVFQRAILAGENGS